MTLKCDNRTFLNESLSKIDIVTHQEFETITTQIYEVLNEIKCKSSDKHSKDSYIDLLVDCYLQTFSSRVFQILVGISSPLGECLFNNLMNKVNTCNNLQIRHSVLILISNIVHRSPTWLPNIVNLQLLNNFFNILKHEQEFVILVTSCLILVELIATLPYKISPCLDDIFNCFSRLSAFLYKKINENDKNNDLLFLNLNSTVYRLFLRLYAMYPCNWFNYLKSNYGLGCNKENIDIFNQIIEPMLTRLRFHPLLITASKNNEVDKLRWRNKEPHDILDECCQYSIDPIEFNQESKSYDEYFVCDNDEEICHYNDYNLEEDENINSLKGENLPSRYNDCEENSIFSKLNEEINMKNSSGISLLNAHFKPNVDSKQIDDGSSKGAEYAQEAIMLGKENSDICSNNSSNKLSVSDRTLKKLVVPVVIPSDSKINNTGTRTSLNKLVSFSHFKPIKEDSINAVFSKNNSPFPNQTMMSPIGQYQVTANTSIDHFNANIENEEEDMEIVQISNNFNQNSKEHLKLKKKPVNRQLFSIESKKSKSEISIANDDNAIVSTQHKFIETHDLINNAKSSLKQTNGRIRYKSYCLAESNRENDSFCCPNDSLSGSLTNLHTCVSCPLLYFKVEGEVKDDSFQNEGPNDTNNESNPVSNSIDSNQDSKGNKSNNQKTKVNLILNNPDLEHSRKPLNLKKTCKSVDFTKEAKRRCAHHIRRENNFYNNFNRYLSNKHSECSFHYPFFHDSKKNIFDSNTSIDMNFRYKSDIGLKKYTPHELLDRMLLMNSEFCLKELNDRISVTNENSECAQDSRRNSFMNTHSSNGSIEQIPYINFMNTSEEYMRKLVAIMYTQLVFERHQRDSHVIRNRRLYKKFKECIELQEKYKALKDQLIMKDNEISRLRYKLDEDMASSDKQKKLLNNEIVQLEEKLLAYESKCHHLTNLKNNIEKQYKEEIQLLNKNYRSAELELNNNNADFERLKKENTDLKNQIFLFREFYNNIRESYMKTKIAPDMNDKLLINSLKYDNNDLKEKLTNTNLKLQHFESKCLQLEEKIKQDQSKMKNKDDFDNVECLKESLKLKNNHIETLKTLVVTLETHIRKLNAQPSVAKQSFKCSRDENNEVNQHDENLNKTNTSEYKIDT